MHLDSLSRLRTVFRHTRSSSTNTDTKIMPVTIKVADHPSNHWSRSHVDSREALFARSCSKEFHEASRIIQSSISQDTFQYAQVSPNTHGYVNAAFTAYNMHQHLTIRPDDIWFAILSQLNFYINAHAEELRDHFVAHEGKKKLVVEEIGTIKTVDFGVLSRRMTGLLQQNVKDPDFRDWIMPTFSTTTVDDRTTAAV